MLRSIFTSGLMLAAFSSSALANDPAHPTVVELYQSQGCSSCPPAVANLNALSGRADVLPLMFAVTYWDQLGWKDTFAKPEYTQRQYDFAKAAGRDGVATPQVIVNGRRFANGGARGELVAAIRAADRGASGPTIALSGQDVAIGSDRADRPATIWLVRYDPRSLPVPIRAGENGGRTIIHRNIVRSLKAIGQWSGNPVKLAISPGGDGNYRSAILVQSGPGGPIIAAARI